MMNGGTVKIECRLLGDQRMEARLEQPKASHVKNTQWNRILSFAVGLYRDLLLCFICIVAVLSHAAIKLYYALHKDFCMVHQCC